MTATTTPKQTDLDISQQSSIFPVYLDIEVGGKSKEQLLGELKSESIIMPDDCIEDIMSRRGWEPGERERVKFSRVTVGELGFTENPTIANIWARILELGHSLCKPGDGPAIRLVLKDQPLRDKLVVAMKQIFSSHDQPCVFLLSRHSNGGLWLSAPWARNSYPRALDDGIIFRHRM